MKRLGMVGTSALSARWRRGRQPLLEDRNIRYLYIDTALQGLVIGGIYTFIPVFVVRLGASSLLVSLITSLPAIILVLTSIPAGLYVERRSNVLQIAVRSRYVLQFSYLLVALTPFLFDVYLAELVVVIWSLQAIPTALVTPAWTAVVAEIIPPKRRPSVNGGRWALVSMITAVVVALFGYMLERMSFPGNYQLVFALSFLGGMASISFFSLIKFSPQYVLQTSLPQVVTLKQRLQRYTQSFGETPTFLIYLFTTFVLRFGLAMPMALYSIYWVRYLNASDLMIGWQTTTGNIALIAGYFLWGRLATSKGHHFVLMICTLCMGFYPILTGITASAIWLPFVALVRGFFVTGIDISFFDTLLQVCPAGKRASFIAVNSVFANLALFLAPIAGSLMTDWLDIRTVFFITGGVHLLAAFLFRVFRVAEDEE